MSERSERIGWGGVWCGAVSYCPWWNERAEGALRVTAILLLLALVAVVLFAPDQIL